MLIDEPEKEAPCGTGFVALHRCLGYSIVIAAAVGRMLLDQDRWHGRISSNHELSPRDFCVESSISSRAGLDWLETQTTNGNDAYI